MLDFFRLHRNLVSVVFLLVVVSFLFFGIESYLPLWKGKGSVVLEVGDKKVTLDRFDHYRRNEILMMQRLLGSSRDNSFFHSTQFKRYLFYRALDQLLLSDVIHRYGLIVTDQTLRQSLLRLPEFRDGSHFSLEKYHKFLEDNNISSSQYEWEFREKLLVEQLEAPISRTLDSSSVKEKWSDTLASVAYVSRYNVPISQVVEDVVISPEEISDYYQNHLTTFFIPESLKLEYVVLDRSVWEQLLPVSEEEIEVYYDGHKDDYVLPERRRVRHILFRVPRDSTEDMLSKKNTLMQSLEALKERLEGGSEDFSSLASEYSEDINSRSRGGDLGWISKGDLLPVVEKTVFDLEVGQCSAVVESDFGFHLFYLEDIADQRLQTMEEVRGPIVRSLQLAKSAENFPYFWADFENSVHDVDDLESLADQYSLTLERSNWIYKGLFEDHSRINTSVIHDEMFRIFYRRHQSVLSMPLEIEPGVWVVARLLEYRAQYQPELQDVHGQIVENLRSEKALERIKENGIHPDWVWTEPVFLTRQDSSNIPEEILEELLFLGSEDLKEPQYASLHFTTKEGVTFYQVKPVPESEFSLYMKKMKDSQSYWSNLLSSDADSLRELSWFLSAVREEAYVRTNFDLIASSTEDN